MATILVVDDEPSARTTLALLLSKRGHRVTQAEGAHAAAKALADESFDSRRHRPADAGRLRPRRPGERAAPRPGRRRSSSSRRTAPPRRRRGDARGAFDVLLKPVDPTSSSASSVAASSTRLRRENERLRARIASEMDFDGVVAQSPPMRRVLDTVRRVAPTTATVLVTGESGTGKERIAKPAPPSAPTPKGPFVAVNCGALPESAARERALRPRQGRLHRRRREQGGPVRGGRRRHALPRRDRRDAAARCRSSSCARCRSARCARSARTERASVDVRVVAATNRDLEQTSRGGALPRGSLLPPQRRRDPLPPLRERREDIPVLAEAFLRYRSEARGGTRLGSRRWRPWARFAMPGRATSGSSRTSRARGDPQLGRGDQRGDLPAYIGAASWSGRRRLPTEQGLAEVERVHVLQAPERVGWNHSRAAQTLRIGRTTLWRKLKEYGLTR